MASQPTFAPYIPLPSAAPRPNIRIAYIAGDASIAIHRGMASFPPAVRESTLEELAIAGLTDELIAAGRELLSPAMYSAFLRWGETASHVCTDCPSDQEANIRADANLAACAAIADIPALTVHDMLFKVRMLNTEAGDCPDFGPVSSHNADGKKLPPLIDGVDRDMPSLSPFISLLDQLTNFAWGYSPVALNAIDPRFGSIITDAFRAAREALENDPPLPAPIPAILEGYSPYMRGPLIAWRKAYAAYTAADDELKTFERTTYKSTGAAFDAVRGDRNTPVTPELAAALEAVPMDAVQDRFDELVMARHEAVERLMRIPAPSASELATKLQFFRADEGWDLEYAPEVVERLTTDARRFGKHGPFLQSDGSILAAFAGCRHEMIGAHGPEAMTREQEDAYFARLDAYETTMLDSPASTIEGVIAKLRLAFSRLEPNAWSDHAIMDVNSRDFISGLRMSGMFERIAWGAIEDLARIGGVNLVEQGA